MNKLLFADSAGPGFQRIYANSSYALAALVPASLVSPPDGAIAKVADVGLAVAITAHNHIGLNYGEQGALNAAGLLAGWRPAPAQPSPLAAFAALDTNCKRVTIKDDILLISIDSVCCILHFVLAVVADYVPRGLQVPVRAGVLGISVLTALGLTKLAITGEAPPSQPTLLLIPASIGRFFSTERCWS
jgi:hypothetical protein